jgi:hypothetical protein
MDLFLMVSRWLTSMRTSAAFVPNMESILSG